jgi:hypothetical protein
MESRVDVISSHNIAGQESGTESAPNSANSDETNRTLASETSKISVISRDV